MRPVSKARDQSIPPKARPPPRVPQPDGSSGIVLVDDDDDDHAWNQLVSAYSMADGHSKAVREARREDDDARDQTALENREAREQARLVALEVRNQAVAEARAAREEAARASVRASGRAGGRGAQGLVGTNFKSLSRLS